MWSLFISIAGRPCSSQVHFCQLLIAKIRPRTLITFWLAWNDEIVEENNESNLPFCIVESFHSQFDNDVIQRQEIVPFEKFSNDPKGYCRAESKIHHQNEMWFMLVRVPLYAWRIDDGNLVVTWLNEHVRFT